MYKEEVKGNQQGTIADTISHYAGALKAEPNSYYHYEKNVLEWGRKWPVHARSFSSRRNVVGDFLAQCQVSIDTTDMVIAERENEGMSETSAMLLMRLNRMFAKKKIGLRERKIARRNIQRHSRQLHELFSSLLTLEEIDVREFKTAFADQNPHMSFAWEFDDSLMHAVDVELTDEDILAAALSAAG